jgi:hypothetical protein
MKKSQGTRKDAVLAWFQISPTSQHWCSGTSGITNFLYNIRIYGRDVLQQAPCAIGMVTSQWIEDFYMVNIPSWGKIYFKYSDIMPRFHFLLLN